uniref:Major sperm protein n=1 Tax=Strongyloides papillosus TaxID=174720 RepID=A0A0N5B659_STREA
MNPPAFFNFESHNDKQTKVLVLRNTSNKDVVYKVRQSCSLSVKVKPCVGAIRRGEFQRIEVTLNESFSKIESKIGKIYLDVYCMDVNKNNFKERRSWLYGNDECIGQLSHRFIIKKISTECPRKMVIDLPARALLIDPIVLPIDYYTEGDTKTCHPIDDGTNVAETFDWKDKMTYCPKNKNIFNNEPVMKSHIRTPSHRVVSNIGNDEKPKKINGNNGSNGIIQCLAKFLFPPNGDNTTSKENINNDVTGPLDLKADVTTYKAYEKTRKRGTIGICGV